MLLNTDFERGKLVMASFSSLSSSKSIICLTEQGFVIVIDPVPVDSIVKLALAGASFAAVTKALAAMKPRRVLLSVDNDGSLCAQTTLKVTKAACNWGQLVCLDSLSHTLFSYSFGNKDSEGSSGGSTAVLNAVAVECEDFSVDSFQDCKLLVNVICGSGEQGLMYKLLELSSTNCDLIAECALGGNCTGALLACELILLPADKNRKVFGQIAVIDEASNTTSSDANIRSASCVLIAGMCKDPSQPCQAIVVGNASVDLGDAQLAKFETPFRTSGNGLSSCVCSVIDSEKSTASVFGISTYLRTLVCTSLVGMLTVHSRDNGVCANAADDKFSSHLSAYTSGIASLGSLSADTLCSVLVSGSMAGLLAGYSLSLRSEDSNGTAHLTDLGEFITRRVLSLLNGRAEKMTIAIHGRADDDTRSQSKTISASQSASGSDMLVLLSIILHFGKGVSMADILQAFSFAVTSSPQRPVCVQMCHGKPVWLSHSEFVLLIHSCFEFASRATEWKGHSVTFDNSADVEAQSRLQMLLSDLSFQYAHNKCLEGGHLQTAMRLNRLSRSLPALCAQTNTTECSKMATVVLSRCVRELKTVIPVAVSALDLCAYVQEVGMPAVSALRDHDSTQKLALGLAAELCKRGMAVVNGTSAAASTQHFAALHLGVLALKFINTTPNTDPRLSLQAQKDGNQKALATPVGKVQALYQQLRTLCCLRTVYYYASIEETLSLGSVAEFGLTGLLFNRLWDVEVPSSQSVESIAQTLSSVFDKELDSVVKPAAEYFSLNVDDLLKQWIEQSVAERVIVLESMSLTNGRSEEDLEEPRDDTDSNVCLWKLTEAVKRIQCISNRADVLLLLLQLPVIADCKQAHLGNTATSVPKTVEDAIGTVSTLCRAAQECVNMLSSTQTGVESTNQQRDKLIEALRLQKIRTVAASYGVVCLDPRDPVQIKSAAYLIASKLDRDR
jgi:hypothetical protein